VHHRWTLGPVQHDQLKQVSGLAGTENQVASRIFDEQ